MERALDEAKVESVEMKRQGDAHYEIVRSALVAKEKQYDELRQSALKDPKHCPVDSAQARLNAALEK